MNRSTNKFIIVTKVPGIKHQETVSKSGFQMFLERTSSPVKYRSQLSPGRQLPESSMSEGSTFGERKAMKRLRW